jgi:hypothetical protein
MHRLLVISCSQKKLSHPRLLPAIERYDGPAFRVLRKYLRESSDPFLTVLILSAKHGLIESDRKISSYDCRLSKTTATKLQPQVVERARLALQSSNLEAVGVCAGKDYTIALAGLSSLIPKGVRLDLLAGGLGPRLTELRSWLRRSTTSTRFGT